MDSGMLLSMSVVLSEHHHQRELCDVSTKLKCLTKELLMHCASTGLESACGLWSARKISVSSKSSTNDPSGPVMDRRLTLDVDQLFAPLESAFSGRPQSEDAWKCNTIVRLLQGEDNQNEKGGAPHSELYFLSPRPAPSTSSNSPSVWSPPEITQCASPVLSSLP
eukprot:RCo019746